jgi:hypothetical protein
LGTIAIMSLAATLSGCSGMGAAMTGGRMAWNASRESNEVRVFLDGQKGSKNVLEKAWKGPEGTFFKISEPVSTTPRFKYIIKDPEKIGRIVGVTMQIHREFDDEFSHLADYVIYSRDNSPESQLQPDTTYDLGSLQSNFEIRDYQGNAKPKVELEPGREYRLVLTVRGDRSESVIVEFETR